MKISFLNFFTVFAVLISSSVVAAEEPLRLSPSSKWAISYDATKCRLARGFGEGNHQSTLIFQRAGPGESFTMRFGGNPFKVRHKTTEIELQFGAYEERQRINFYKGEMDGVPAIIQRGSARIAPHTEAEEKRLSKQDYDEFYAVDPISEERESAVTYLAFTKGLSKQIILETGSLGNPFAALNRCIDDLVLSWGFEPSIQANLSMPALPQSNPGDWLKSSEYPKDMLVQGQSGIVDFRINVDLAGLPVSCHIQATTRPKEFDDAVCGAIMRRAKFKPALDKEGNPIASFYMNKVLFDTRAQ